MPSSANSIFVDVEPAEDWDSEAEPSFGPAVVSKGAALPLGVEYCGASGDFFLGERLHLVVLN